MRTVEYKQQLHGDGMSFQARRMAYRTIWPIRDVQPPPLPPKPVAATPQPVPAHAKRTTCLHCGKPLPKPGTAKRGRVPTVFCSTRCRKLQWQAEHRKGRVCKICGTSLVHDPSKRSCPRSAYCSDRCAAMGRELFRSQQSARYRARKMNQSRQEQLPKDAAGSDHPVTIARRRTVSPSRHVTP